MCQRITAGNAPELENADLVEYDGEDVTPGTYPPVYYDKGLEYKCHQGYTTTGDSSGATKITTKVGPYGGFDPTLPTECKAVTYAVNGRVRNAQNSEYITGATIKITDPAGNVHTGTQSWGSFSVYNVPGGSVTVEYTADGFITGNKVIDLTGNINIGGEADINMSPEMANDQWRAVLKWQQEPYDLDTYIYWNYGTKVCWYELNQYDQVGMDGTLEQDYTNGFGPETLYLSHVGECSGYGEACDMTYEINDYRGTSDMLNKGGIEVTLYNGDHEAGHWKIEDCAGTVYSNQNWWKVFTINGKTNQVTWSCSQGLNLHQKHHKLGGNTTHHDSHHDVHQANQTLHRMRGRRQQRWH
jgi:hypothetical protein